MNTCFNLKTRILHILLIKSYHYPNLGLLSGRMGISLFFIYYSIKTGQHIFRDYAFDIIDKMAEEINQNTPLGLDSGMAGIGWGIEYLLKYELIEGEGVDICEAIDNKIMQTDPRRINDLSLETGLEGLLHYILAHIQGASMKKTNLPFDYTYLKDLYTAVCSISLHKSTCSMRGLIKTYKDFYEEKQEICYDVKLADFTEKIEVDENNIHAIPLGLRNGLAGYMLNSGINL